MNKEEHKPALDKSTEDIQETESTAFINYRLDYMEVYEESVKRTKKVTIRTLVMTALIIITSMTLIISFKDFSMKMIIVGCQATLTLILLRVQNNQHKKINKDSKKKRDLLNSKYMS